MRARLGPVEAPADHTSIQVQRAIRGERDGISWIVSHFQPFVESQVRLRLRGHGTQQDIEDLVAEVWLSTLRHLSNLVPRQGRHAPVLVTYLGTTVLHACNNWLRKRARRAAVHGEPPRPLEAENHTFDRFADETLGIVTRVARGDVKSQIARCLAQLDDDKRDVLVLRLMEHRSNQEIAKLLGVPPNTVAVRYRRALDELRARLPEELFGEIRSALA